MAIEKSIQKLLGDIDLYKLNKSLSKKCDHIWYIQGFSKVVNGEILNLYKCKLCKKEEFLTGYDNV